MTIESQEEEMAYNRFYDSIARYYKESEEMTELRKEDIDPNEIAQTIVGSETYHEVLDSINIPYPVSIERSLQVVKEIDKLQKQIEEFKNDRPTRKNDTR